MGRLLEQPTLVVGDDGLSLIVLLVGVVASIKEVIPVVDDYIGSDNNGLGQNGDTSGGLLHGILLGPPLIKLGQ